MKQYTSFEEINLDLRQYELERKIAVEELKLIQGKVEEDLKPVNLILSVLKVVGKIGMFRLIKKVLS